MHCILWTLCILKCLLRMQTSLVVALFIPTVCKYSTVLYCPHWQFSWCLFTLFSNVFGFILCMSYSSCFPVSFLIIMFLATVPTNEHVLCFDQHQIATMLRILPFQRISCFCALVHSTYSSVASLTFVLRPRVQCFVFPNRFRHSHCCNETTAVAFLVAASRAGSHLPPLRKEVQVSFLSMHWIY